MRKYKGGEKAGKGTYWNFSNGHRVNMETEGILPGDEKATYRKLSPVGILLLGPILGLVYAAFLPFIGIAMLLKLLGQRLLGGVFGMAGSSVSFRWRPQEAYLSGKKKSKNTEKAKEGEKPEDSEARK